MSRLLAASVFSCSSASAERLPWTQACLLPLGAPLLVPPCIRHRFRPRTAGDRQGRPLRALAPQRGACAKISGCMALSVKSEIVVQRCSCGALEIDQKFDFSVMRLLRVRRRNRVQYWLNRMMLNDFACTPLSPIRASFRYQFLLRCLPSQGPISGTSPAPGISGAHHILVARPATVGRPCTHPRCLRLAAMSL